MINDDNATADDLIKLGNKIKAEVKNKTNIDLEWEIKIHEYKTTKIIEKTGLEKPILENGCTILVKKR